MSALLGDSGGQGREEDVLYCYVMDRVSHVKEKKPMSTSVH